jgi:predicted transcriptional regulator
MGEKPALSRGEMEVARVLWQLGPAGVRVIHEAMNADKPIDFATVQTYLRRLETKGYATSKLEGRSRIYSAKTRPKTVIRDTVNDLVDRLFGGDTMPLVRHLIEERGIDADDLQTLRAMIDRLERQSDKENE